MITSIMVNVLGLAIIVGIVWFHWGPRAGVRAQAASGVQEAAITVKGGYSPDVIVLRAHQPVRLRFTRNESSSCSEMVVFDGLEKSAKLPTGQEVTIDIPALDPGEYPFACQMGMLRGKLIVEADSNR